jgi:L,D-transpeptidase ErfK/SrfK
MKAKPCGRAAAATLALSLGLTGCSLLSAPWHRQSPAETAPPPAAPAAPAVAQLPLPVATLRFEVPKDDDLFGGVQITVASKEDTLPDIARRFDVGYEEIVRANPGVDPWLPGAGRTIVVPSQFVLPNAEHVGVVINLAAMRLYYFPKHKPGRAAARLYAPDRCRQGRLAYARRGHAYRLARDRPDLATVDGVRQEHEENGDPVPAVVPPGPDNPLGRYKFTLGWPEYLIHGTNKPYGVGLRSSHGCIRLYPEDIEKLYQMVPLGTQVRVVNQPFLFGWHDQQLYLQAYTVLEDDPRDWQKASKTLLAKSMSPRLQQLLKASGNQVDWQAISQISHEPRGIAVPVSGALESVDAVLAAAPKVQNRIPPGSNWSGDDERDADQQSYQQLLSEREPQKAAPAPVAAPPHG